MDDSSACGCTWQKVNEYQFGDVWMKSRYVYCMSREATERLQAGLLQFENEHMPSIQVLPVVRCIFLPG